MKLLEVALALLAVLPAEASRRKDYAVRKSGNFNGGTYDPEPDTGDVSATLERMEKSLMSARSDVASETMDSGSDGAVLTSETASLDAVNATSAAASSGGAANRASAEEEYPKDMCTIVPLGQFNAGKLACCPPGKSKWGPEYTMGSACQGRESPNSICYLWQGDPPCYALKKIDSGWTGQGVLKALGDLAKAKTFPPSKAVCKVIPAGFKNAGKAKCCPYGLHLHGDGSVCFAFYRRQCALYGNPANAGGQCGGPNMGGRPPLYSPPKKPESAAVKNMLGALQAILRKNMMPKIIAEQKAAQAALARLYAAYEKCTSLKTKSSKSFGRLLISRRAISVGFKKCRKTEAATAIRAKQCKIVLTADNSAKKASCDAFKAIQKINVKTAATVCKTVGENYGAWVTRLSIWTTKEATKYKRYKIACEKASRKSYLRTKKCTPATKSLISSKKICDARQRQLEAATCSIVTRAHSACQEYLPCFVTAKAALDKEIPEIKRLAKIRWAQWRYLKRLDCLVGHGCKANKAQIDACTKKAYSDDKRHLRLVFKKIPFAPTRCEYPTAPTCSARYVATYYSSLPRMARAKACNSCVGLAGSMGSLPLPKNFKVRCAHDPAWSYVLDYSDDRTTDDLPDSRQLIAAGFSNPNAFYIGNLKLEKLDIDKAEVCALSSTTRTSSGQCQWSCKRLDDMYYGGGKCPTCTGLQTKVKKMIAGLSGQVVSGDIMRNFRPGFANFQENMGGVQWSCGPRKNRIFPYGPLGWVSYGHGITMRADLGAGRKEVGWATGRCGWRKKLDVDTLHIRVQLKPIRFTAPKPKPYFGGAMFGIKGFQMRCAHERGWTYVLDYSDDRQVDDIPGGAAGSYKISGGFTNRNAYYIGNAKLNALKIKEAQMCFLSSTTKTKEGKCQWSCITLKDEYWGGGSFCNACQGGMARFTGVKKIIAGLSGQMRAGLVMNGKAGMLNARFQDGCCRNIKLSCGTGNPMVMYGNPGWAINGYGVSARFEHGKGYYEIGWPSKQCGWETRLDVDTLQIRVKI